MSVPIIVTPHSKLTSALCWFRSAAEQLQLMLDKHRQRQQLAQLTIEQLMDMGIDPADAYKEISKPFWK